MNNRPGLQAEHGTSHVIPDPRRHAVIEKNGDEFLVTINGAVFLALSLAGAEAIARRSDRRSAYRHLCGIARDSA